MGAHRQRLAAAAVGGDRRQEGDLDRDAADRHQPCEVGQKGHVAIPADAIAAPADRRLAIDAGVVQGRGLHRGAGRQRAGEAGGAEGQQARAIAAGRFGKDHHVAAGEQTCEVRAFAAQAIALAPFHEHAAGQRADTTQETVLAGLDRGDEHRRAVRRHQHRVDPREVVGDQQHAAVRAPLAPAFTGQAHAKHARGQARIARGADRVAAQLEVIAWHPPAGEEHTDQASQHAGAQHDPQHGANRPKKMLSEARRRSITVRKSTQAKSASCAGAALSAAPARR